MSVRNFNDAEKEKLIQLIKQGSQVLSEVDDLKEGLKDTVKAIAEELELKPAIINKAISIAHRDNYKTVADNMDLLDSILTAAGKI
jgi:transposase-like protein